MSTLSSLPTTAPTSLARWIQIPNTLASWPWSRKINPHYDSGICKAETSAWIEPFSALDKSVQEALNKCMSSLFVALCYPSLDKEGFHVGCDLLSVLFMIDEYTDKEAPDAVQIKADIVMDAVHHPHHPRLTTEWIGGEIVRQFWENAISNMTLIAQRRFIDAFQTYLKGVVEEAQDRTTHRLRTIESYFEIRRKTVATRVLFVLCEMDLNIPDDIMRHPVIETLTSLSVDMSFIENDLLSYNKEQARGDPHNLITVAMREFNTDVQAAIDWAGNYHKSLERQFLHKWLHIPTVTLGLPEQAGRDVQGYCERLAYCVRGNKCWSFESERYFGTCGLEIQKTRRVELLPGPGMPISIFVSCDGQCVQNSWDN